MEDRLEDYLTDTERSLLTTALRAAAERWEEWAGSVANRQVSDMFKQQAHDARKLADRIDKASDVMVL